MLFTLPGNAYWAHQPIYGACPENLVQGGGFEPPKLSRQIYSLIPLAAREPLRKMLDIVHATSLAVK